MPISKAGIIRMKDEHNVYVHFLNLREIEFPCIIHQAVEIQSLNEYFVNSIDTIRQLYHFCLAFTITAREIQTDG